MERKALRQYQVEDLSFLIKEGKSGNLSDPGTGKTPSMNVWLEWAAMNKGAKCVINMPTHLYYQNKASILEFTNFKDHQVHILDGTPEKKMKMMEDPEGLIYLTSFNFYAPKHEKKQLSKLRDGLVDFGNTPKISDWDYLRTVQASYGFKTWANVVDELHLGYKSATATRTQKWMTAHRIFKYFVAMTATPVDGRLDTVYPFISVIEPRYYMNHGHFLKTHAVRDENDKIVEWVGTERIAKILNRHCIRRTFEDVYGKANMAPPIIERVTMLPEQFKLYERMKEEGLLNIEQQIQTASEEEIRVMMDMEVGAGQQFLRARQLLQCPEDLGHKFKGTLPKDDAVATHMQNCHAAKEALLVFCVNQSEVERLAKMGNKIGVPTGYIHGGLSPRKKEEVSQRFIRGELMCVVATPDTTGTGYNWQHVDEILWSTLDYKDSSWRQGLQRAIRGEREKTLRVYVLQYMNSFDQILWDMLKRKSKLAEASDPTRLFKTATSRSQIKIDNSSSYFVSKKRKSKFAQANFSGTQTLTGKGGKRLSFFDMGR